MARALLHFTAETAAVGLPNTAALVVYDLTNRGCVHPATLWGGLFLIASQPLRLAVSDTSAWVAFAQG